MSARGGSRGKRKRGKRKPSKMIDAARRLDSTIPGKDKTPFTCPKCGRDSYHPRDKEERWCGACGDVAAEFTCFLCEAAIPQDAVKEQFCHGCKKLICEKHDNCELPMGGHDPEAHDEQPEEDEDDGLGPPAELID